MIRTSQARTSFCYPTQKTESKLRLFCFPHAGSGTTAYRSWANLLPAEIEVCIVQLPGREERLLEKPHQHIEDVVAALVEEIEPHLDKPFVFFGHSMGALISYELTRALRKRGKKAPLQLMVSGYPAPHLPSGRISKHQLPDGELIEELRRLGGTDETVLSNRPLMEFVLPVIRADFAVCETYEHVPGAAMDLPLFAYGGDADPTTSVEQLKAWAELTTGPFQARIYQGDHFYFLAQPQTLLAALVTDLQAVWVRIR